MGAITGISGITPGLSNAAEIVKANGPSGLATQAIDDSEKAGGAFPDVLGNAIEAIAKQQTAAEAKVLDVAAGRSDDLAGMMVAVNKAGLAMTLGLEVRNRVLDAYHEVMRMQV